MISDEIIMSDTFISAMRNRKISHSIAITGSYSRNELRTNSSQYDYNSDIDILCIVLHKDIRLVQQIKEEYHGKVELILMDSNCINTPSNAILSLTERSFIYNGLNLVLPDFSYIEFNIFFEFQIQPLAYYKSKLETAKKSERRRLLYKVAISCLRIIYSSENSEHRTFIYEKNIKSWAFKKINSALAADVLERNIPDQDLMDSCHKLEEIALSTAINILSSPILRSVQIYLSRPPMIGSDLIEQVFIENNNLSRSEALFIRN